MPTAANTPQPSVPKERPASFSEQQGRYRTQAKIGAALIGVVGCLMAWSFGFVVIGALAIYASFLSRLMPHQLTEMYAYVMDPAGGIVGVSAAAVLFTAGLWWFASRILSADISAGLIWRLRARLPDPADVDEQQLVSSAEELAFDAGTETPAVLLFAGPCLNAAVIGDRPEGAGMIIPRQQLNTLDPEEKQGVLAHLMAFAVNGDLSLTAAMWRIFSMTGIALTLLDLPFSPSARKTITVLWRYARQSGPDMTAQPSDDVGPALTRALQPDGLDSLVIVVRKLIGEETDIRSILGIILLLPMFPFLVLRLGAGSIYSVTSLFILSPLTALLMRSRRMLADTTAVKLTRNPDGLARALIRLHAAAHRLPETGWSEMNFVIGPEAANARVFDRFRIRLAEAIATANNFNRRLRNTAAPMNPSGTAGAPPASEVAGHNFVFGFHPPLGMRIVQLNKLGAKVAWPDRADRSSWLIAAMVTGVVGGILLLLLV